ncbi:MAG: cupredoxin family protein [Pseudomonadota bacterium]
MVTRIAIAALTFCVALGTGAFAGPGQPGHSHESFSAGQPGDPKKPARVVLVTMREGDGKMMFIPNRVEIKKGEQIRFMLQNSGELDHEFVLASTEDNLKHAEAMKKSPDMEHDDPNAKRLAPKAKGEIVWRFTKAGQFEYGCLIPGHREAGMTGTIVVK